MKDVPIPCLEPIARAITESSLEANLKQDLILALNGFEGGHPVSYAINGLAFQSPEELPAEYSRIWTTYLSPKMETAFQTRGITTNQTKEVYRTFCEALNPSQTDF